MVRRESVSHASRTVCILAEQNALLKGESSWLEALPVRDQDFGLSKSEFRDALCLKYGWTPERLPATCVCGTSFDVTHAL